MKVSARYQDPALAGEPLPEHVQAWVDDMNAGRLLSPYTFPAYHGERKFVVEIAGEAPSAARHWAQ